MDRLKVPKDLTVCYRHPPALRKFSHKSNFAQVGIECVLNYIRIYEEAKLQSKHSTLEPDRWRHGRLVACVIAQQHSPATFVSLRFHFRQGKFGEHLQKSYIFFFLFKICMRPTLHNLNLLTHGSVCG